MISNEKQTILDTLQQLRRKLRGLYWIHGIGALFLYLAGCVLASYLLDRNLHLPAFLRVCISLGAGTGFVIFFYRWLVYPLRKELGESDIALALERRFPELREKLVSAVELSEKEIASPELLQELQHSALSSLRELPLASAFDPRRPTRVLALACLATVINVGVFWMDTGSFSIWAQRFLGGDLRWPQETFLDIQIPTNEGNIRVEKRGSTIQVELVQGTELTIRVVANGSVPETANLRYSDGKSRTLLRTSNREFIHLFPAVRDGFSFWVTGGDDQDNDPIVEVVPIQAPSLAKISTRIEFPAYSGIEARLSEGGHIEALVGSQAQVFVETSQEIARGQLRFQQSGQLFALAASEEKNKFSCSFPITGTDRYTVEVFDQKGLKNQEGTSYTIVAAPDRKPELRIFNPARTDLDITPKGRLALRASLQDDFGLGKAEIFLKLGKNNQFQEATLPLPIPAPDAKDAIRKQAFLESGIEIEELRLGDRPPHEGEVIYFKLRAQDNRTPEPNLAESNEIRVILVSTEELERRLFDSLTRIKESVELLGNLQREKWEQAQTLQQAMEGSGALSTADQVQVKSTALGQSRVTANAKNISNQLIEVFESAVYNRLQKEANSWIQEYESLRPPMSKAAAEESLTLLGQMLQSQQDGKLGSAELYTKLLEMAHISLLVSDRLAKEANRSFEKVGVSLIEKEQKVHFAAAIQAQKAILDQIDKLLEKLAEWDNYQTVLNLSRELLEKQKVINSGTKEMSKQR